MDRCIFCEIAAGRLPAAIVYEDDRVVAFFDKAPIGEYHTLVIPKHHARDIFDVSDRDIQAMASAIKKICRLYRDQLGMEDLQVISSNGAAAQQDVFHFHVHIVPRRHNDGQDIKWTPDPAIAERFEVLLARLNMSLDIG